MSLQGKQGVAAGVALCAFSYLTQYQNPWKWPWVNSAGLDVQKLLDGTEYPKEKSRLNPYSFDDPQLKRHVQRYFDKNEIGRRLHREKMIMYVNWTVASPAWLTLGAVWGGYGAYESTDPTKATKKPTPTNSLFAAFQVEPTKVTSPSPSIPTPPSTTASAAASTTEAAATAVTNSAEAAISRAPSRTATIITQALGRGLLSGGAGFLLLPVYLYFMDKKAEPEHEGKFKKYDQALLAQPSQGLRNYLEYVLEVREIRMGNKVSID